MKQYKKTMDLWAEGYYPLSWNSRPIFVSRERTRFRDVYAYNRKVDLFELKCSIDIRKGLEKALEEAII